MMLSSTAVGIDSTNWVFIVRINLFPCNFCLFAGQLLVLLFSLSLALVGVEIDEKKILFYFTYCVTFVAMKKTFIFMLMDACCCFVLFYLCELKIKLNVGLCHEK